MVVGEFGPKDLVVEYTGRKFEPAADLAEQIEKKWAKLGWKRNDNLARLETYGLEEGKLVLTLGETDGKRYVGARDFEYLRKYGFDGIANVLAVSSVVQTADGKILVAKRQKGDAVGAIDGIAGNVSPGEDLFAAAMREVEEETGIDVNELKDGRVIGLVYEYGKDLCHPVMGFVFKTDLTAEQVMSRKTDEEIKVVALDKDEFVSVLLDEKQPMEPDGRLVMQLARRILIRGMTYEKQLLLKPDQI